MNAIAMVGLFFMVPASSYLDVIDARPFGYAKVWLKPGYMRRHSFFMDTNVIPVGELQSLI